MTLPSIVNKPFQLIECHTTAEDASFLNRFMIEMKKLYQYEIFKHMLDLVTTLCLNKKLRFNVYDRRFFELDEGNCKTIEGSSFNKIFNKLKKERTYVVTIKKISADVIVHEIAHMMEKEGEFATLQPFMQHIEKDIRAQNSNNVSLKAAVKQIFVTEVEGYPGEQKSSEFFARFFQIISMAKEIAGLGAQYGYSLKDVYQYFENTVAFLAGDFYKTVISKIDPTIAAYSKEYIKPLEEIKHKWIETKHAASIHENPSKPTWSRAVKSIKDNPFS